MNTNYNMNGEIATRYGVFEALFIHNLYFGIAKNKADGKHFHDGRYWTCNTMGHLLSCFPSGRLIKFAEL